jgi:hypothetical protein
MVFPYTSHMAGIPSPVAASCAMDAVALGSMVGAMAVSALGPKDKTALAST